MEPGVDSEVACGGQRESVCASAPAHLWPGLRYLEKWAQERPLGPWVPGQPGRGHFATFLGESTSKTISFSKNSVLTDSRCLFVI